MDKVTAIQAKKADDRPFIKIEAAFNANFPVHDIATACEKQCIRCNVNSQKLGRTR